MKKSIRNQIRKRISALIAQNPTLAIGKFLCNIFACIMPISCIMILILPIELMWSIYGSSEEAPTKIQYVEMLVTLLLTFIFLILIAQMFFYGRKSALNIPIILGVITTPLLVLQKVYMMIGPGYETRVRFFALLYIVTWLINLIAPIILLIFPFTKKYLKTANTIYKELTTERKS